MSTPDAKLMSGLVGGEIHYAPLDSARLLQDKQAPAFCGRSIDISQVLGNTAHWFERARRNTPQCSTCLRWVQETPDAHHR